MAQAPQAPPTRLTPSPKALQKALQQSAQRLADAFGVKVPSLKPNAPRSAPHSD